MHIFNSLADKDEEVKLQMSFGWFIQRGSNKRPFSLQLWLKISQMCQWKQHNSNRLLFRVKFNIFPSPTMHIAGWPLSLLEALIANIDAKTWLLTSCHGGYYNVRAFSNMIGETFFTELTMNDRRCQGTV